MPTNSEQLSEAIADVDAEIEEYIEDRQPQIKERIEELLEKPKKRDLAAWKSWKVDAQLMVLTPARIEELSKSHDDVWRYTLGGLRAACVKQAYAEIAIGLLEIFQSGRERILNIAKKFIKSELVEHAKRGTPKAAFKAAKERRRGARSQ